MTTKRDKKRVLGQQCESAATWIRLILLQEFYHYRVTTQPVKSDLNKKLDPKQKIIKPSILMPKGSEKLEMKILPHVK